MNSLSDDNQADIIEAFNTTSSYLDDFLNIDNLYFEGLSEHEFYGDLVYKFKKSMGRTDFSDHFRKIIIRHKRIGYNLNVMRQSACLVINQITVDNFAALLNCAPVDWASVYLMAPT